MKFFIQIMKSYIDVTSFSLIAFVYFLLAFVATALINLNVNEFYVLFVSFAVIMCTPMAVDSYLTRLKNKRTFNFYQTSFFKNDSYSSNEWLSATTIVYKLYATEFAKHSINEILEKNEMPSSSVIVLLKELRQIQDPKLQSDTNLYNRAMELSNA